MLFRLTICLLLSILVGSMSADSGPVMEDNLSFICPVTGNNATGDTLFVNCLPPRPRFLMDDVSVGDEDRLWFEAIDPTSDILSSCNTIVIQVSDLRGTPLPTDCSDILVVDRIIEIYDGDPGDPNVIPQVCNLTYVATIPFNLERVGNFPDPTTISCDADVAGEFQLFLDNFGYQALSSCSSISQLRTNPVTPIITWLPSPTDNPNGCGSNDDPGNGFIRVQFDLIDDCGFEVTTVANFIVRDMEAPEFDLCPDDITIDLNVPRFLTDIEDHLNTAAATDNCSPDVMLMNTFVATAIDMTECNEQTLNILHSADDGCGNVRTNCDTQITITNEGGITLTCPAQELVLECGDPDNENIVCTWLATEVSATEASGGVITNVGNNFEKSNLLNRNCTSTYDVTFEAIDDCSRSETCMQTIIIEDSLTPVTTDCATLRDLEVDADDPQIVNLVTDWINEYTAMDQCNVSMVPQNDFDMAELSFSCGTRPIDVLFTANDNCTDIDSCTKVLTIRDNIVSGFSSFPLDTVVECSTNPDVAALNDWVGQAVAGNNLGVSFTVQSDLVTFNNPDLATCDLVIPVRIFFVDQCGQEVDRIANITVEDTEAPMIVCPVATTINADVTPDVLAEFNRWVESATITDNCGVQPVTTNFEPREFAGCDEVITRPITFRVEDECRNLSDPCVSDLTIVAQKIPSIVCPPRLVMECGDTLNAMLLDNWINGALATSVIGDTLTYTTSPDVSGLDLIDCGNEVEVEFITMDECAPGMTVASPPCVSTVRIEDTTPPNISCPPTITLNSTDTTNEQTIAAWLLDFTADDNGCFGPSVMNDFDISTLDVCNGGDINVTFTVSDQCGFSMSCIALARVNQTAPEVVCPDASVVFECGDQNLESDIDNWLSSITVTDNSGQILSAINDFDLSKIDTVCHQSIPVAFTTTDACGTEGSCLANINIMDTQPPVYVNGCPPTLPLLSGSPVDNKIQSFEDWIAGIVIEDCNEYTLEHDFDTNNFEVNCDDVSIDVRFTLVDECGWIATACDSEISITNNVDATISCADPITIECADPDNEMIIRDWLNTSTASDNLGNSFVVSDDFDFNNPDLIQCSGNILVTFTTVNICTGSSDPDECTSTIRVVDLTDPTVTCPRDTSFVLEDPGFDADVQLWISGVTGMDNCVSTLDYDSDYVTVSSLPPCEIALNIPVTFTAADGCGNSADCVSTLTVTTQNSSAINCPPALTIQCGDADNPQIINDWIALGTGMDADGSVLIPATNFNSADIAAIDDCDGMVTVTFEINDACGNTPQCDQLILVEDTTPPTAICPPDITVNATDPNAVDLANNWLSMNDATDNCSTATALNGFFIPNTLCNSDEITEVEFYAMDVCGLRDTCVSTLTINQDMPTINCPERLQLQCGADDNDMQIAAWQAAFTGMDNSGTVLTPIQRGGTTIDLPNDCQSTNTFTFFVADNCGREDTCLVSIIQRDTLAPDVTNCPAPLSISVETTDLIAQVDAWLASYTALDGCDPLGALPPTNDYNLDIEPFDCGAMQNVVFFAEDACGNIDSSCVSTIDVFNELEVAISCPDPILLKCNSGTLEQDIQLFLNDFEVESMDTWEVQTDLDISSVDTECSEPITQLVTFTLMDRCGNPDECTSSIEFIPAASLYIPEIFRPSASGDDRFFSIRSNIAIETISSFRIYSRWGDLMYEREDFDPNLEQGWDGRSALGNHVQGVYAYRIHYFDIFGNEFEEVGSLTLIE